MSYDDVIQRHNELNEVVFEMYDNKKTFDKISKLLTH